MTNSEETKGATNGPQTASALGGAADELKAEGKKLAEDAKAAALDGVKARKEMASDYAQALASALNKGAEELKSQSRDGTAEFIGNAAGSLSTFAGHIAEREPNELWGEAEKFARARPALFFGAAFALGFGLTRFLKSSQADASDSGSQRPQDRGHDQAEGS